MNQVNQVKPEHLLRTIILNSEARALTFSGALDSLRKKGVSGPIARKALEAARVGEMDNVGYENLGRGRSVYYYSKRPTDWVQLPLNLREALRRPNRPDEAVGKKPAGPRARSVLLSARRIYEERKAPSSNPVLPLETRRELDQAYLREFETAVSPVIDLVDSTMIDKLRRSHGTRENILAAMEAIISSLEEQSR